MTLTGFKFFLMLAHYMKLKNKNYGENNENYVLSHNPKTNSFNTQL
jgi:hypothetical protein